MGLLELKELGLTNGEIKIYSSLLDLGDTTRTELAKISGISPSKIYDVCNRLAKKGIINIVKKEGIFHFSPASPNRIKEFLENKEKEIKEEKYLLEKVLPELLLKYNKAKNKTDVEVFYGWEGMKTIFNDKLEDLKKGDENLVFGATLGKNYEKADTFFLKYYQGVEKKGYKIKIIFNENVRKNKERTGYFNKSKIHKIKYLHQETFTELDLYNDIVNIIILTENPIIVRIKNKEAADAFRKFFDSMWKQAKA